MTCPSCGFQNDEDALFCIECSARLTRPRQAASPLDTMASFSSQSQQDFAPATSSYQRSGGITATLLAPSPLPIAPSLLEPEKHQYPTWFLLACGGMIFGITIVSILIAAAAWRAAQAPSGAIMIVAANAGAVAATKREPGLLLVRKPGDSWTYTFTRDSVDGLGKETHDAGQIVEKTSRDNSHSKPLLVDTSVSTFKDSSGEVQTRTYVNYGQQSSNRSLYLLGYSDDNPNKVHYNSVPELVDKGNWNQNPSFDIDTETETGSHSHTYVTAAPAQPVTLSNGAQISCWTKTISVIAGDTYSETIDDLYCPAIGANIRSEDTITYNNGAKRTTTTYLTKFSLVE